MKRYWITPLTMGAFVLTAVTGILMFFEITTGLVKPIHEWLSWTLVIGGLLHVIDHWTGIRKHLGTWWGRGFVVGGVLLVGIAVWPWSAGGEGEHRGNASEAILARATVAQVAQIEGVTVDSLIMRLTDAGARSVDADRTMGDIAKVSELPVGRLLDPSHDSDEDEDHDDD